MMKIFHERRRNFYIKKEFQRNFILKFCGLVALGAVISGTIIYAMSANTVTTTFVNSRLTIKSTADYILPSVIFSSVVVLAIIGIVTVIFTLLMSHRIGGALYAIEKHVERVASGDLQTKFRLRTKDEIKALAVGMDVMVHNLRDGIVEIKDAVSKIEDAAKRAEASSLSADLKDSVQQLKERVEKFKT